MKKHFSPFYLAYTWHLINLLGSIFGGVWAYSLLIFLSLFFLSNFFEKFYRDNLKENKFPDSAHENCILNYQFFSLLINIYFLFNIGSFNFSTQVGVILSLGFTNGIIGVPSAHEFMHRTNKKFPYELLGLSVISYCHFAHNHIKYHHQKFATEEDKSHPPIGRGLYKHVALVAPWRFLTAIKDKKFGLISLNFLFPLAAMFIGYETFLCWALVSLLSQFFFEVIDYISHYGLDHGTMYAKERMYASWNMEGILYFTFNISRHSDHHANSKKPYYKLSNDKPCPQYPVGGTSVIGVVFAPFFPKYFMNRMGLVIGSKFANSKHPNGLPKL